MFYSPFSRDKEMTENKSKFWALSPASCRPACMWPISRRLPTISLATRQSGAAFRGFCELLAMDLLRPVQKTARLADCGGQCAGHLPWPGRVFHCAVSLLRPLFQAAFCPCARLPAFWKRPNPLFARLFPARSAAACFRQTWQPVSAAETQCAANHSFLAAKILVHSLTHSFIIKPWPESWANPPAKRGRARKAMATAAQ